MNSNEVANILEFYQGKYNVSQSVICDGICAFSTISKPKVEDKDMDYIIVEALLARVGRNVNELEISLDDREYELWDARQVIRSAMWSKDMEKVESELNYYMGEITEEHKLHRQFGLYYMMKLAIWRDEDREKICEMALEALDLTKEIIAIPDVKEDLYTPIEIDLLLTLLHYRYGDWKENYKVENCLRKIIEYVDFYYEVERLEDIEGRAWLELLQLLETRNTPEEQLEYIEKAIACFIKGTGILRLAYVRFMKAKILGKLWSENRDEESLKKQSQNECRMAYVIYEVMKREEQLREIERFCLEVLQWHITI